MKRQVQLTGVRKWFGDDFITLQDELYLAAQTFGMAVGRPFVLSGCEVSPFGEQFIVNQGFAFMVPDNGNIEDGKIVRVLGGIFEASDFPIYINLKTRDKEDIADYGRLYDDGLSKNIIVEQIGYADADQLNEFAIAVNTTGPTQTLRSALQNATHRFVTDTEKMTWNAKLTASLYTASDVLAKLLTVDGTASGLDADLIDGIHIRINSGVFQYSTNGVAWTDVSMTAASILAALLTVDGTGTGLDADLLDGNHATAFQKVVDMVSTNTGNKGVKRDASGNFSANVITVSNIIIA